MVKCLRFLFYIYKFQGPYGPFCFASHFRFHTFKIKIFHCKSKNIRKIAINRIKSAIYGTSVTYVQEPVHTLVQFCPYPYPNCICLDPKLSMPISSPVHTPTQNCPYPCPDCRSKDNIIILFYNIM